ncbi:MAG: hypothetical protein IJ523_04785 [Succinivibrionaceae bacterium]|nr:hypothetical protein [Succinivibrionaceae bacterium]
MKPKELCCTVKVMKVPSKNGESKPHYYVYELTSRSDPKKPGRSKTTSGYCIGKIEGNEFSPNRRGSARLAEISGNRSAVPEKPGPNDIAKIGRADAAATKNSDPSNETEAAMQPAVNQDPDLISADLQIKDYGEYAITIENTKAVYERLSKCFSASDSKLIYVLGVIYFVKGHMPADCIRDVYEMSALSVKWPDLDVSEKSFFEFLKLIGSHPLVCENYCQELISKSSGLIAIGRHTLLACTNQNYLSDFGVKYSTPANKQIGLLSVHDICGDTPLTNKLSIGGLGGDGELRDILCSYDFPADTTFVMGEDFYSDDNMTLYREDGKSFVIPVPDSCVICKAVLENISFTGSFSCAIPDEDGIEKRHTILFAQSTVKELEDKYLARISSASESGNREPSWRGKTHESFRGAEAQAINRALLGKDRIFIFRDEDIHASMISDFEEQIGLDGFHTEDRLKELSARFGLVVLRTNLNRSSSHETETAFELYRKFVMKRKVEAYYDFVENHAAFRKAETCDYYALQGLCFLISVAGQINTEFKNKLQNAKSDCISHMSIRECLAKAARIKLFQRRDNIWRVNEPGKHVSELMLEMGVEIKSDLGAMNSGACAGR